MDLHNIHLIGRRTFELDGCVHFECELSTAHFEYMFLMRMLGKEYQITSIKYDDKLVEFKTTLPWDIYLVAIKSRLVA